MSAEVFSETFILFWKIERDEAITFQDDDALSQCLSSIFVTSDAFEPEEDRLDGELDETQFRKEVSQHIAEYQIAKQDN